MADTSRVKKWTGIISLVVSCISGVVIVGVQTCNQVRDVRAEAKDSKEKAEAGYETLAPAVTELQGIATKGTAWIKNADATISSLEKQLRTMELAMAKYDAYFDLLKDRYAGLSRVRVEAAPNLPAARPTVKTAEPPTADVPSDLNGAYQMQMQLEDPPKR